MVTLDGTVASKEDRKEAKKLAKSVAGVSAIKEKLTVSSSASAPSSSAGAGQSQSGASSTTPNAPSAQGGMSTSGSTSAQSGASAGTSPQAGASANLQIKQQIENSLKNEPTLMGSNVIVNVTDDKIELTGKVPTGKERQTAKRMAESFAGNRQVVDNLTVTGRGEENSQRPPR